MNSKDKISYIMNDLKSHFFNDHNRKMSEFVNLNKTRLSLQIWIDGDWGLEGLFDELVLNLILFIIWFNSKQRMNWLFFICTFGFTLF